MLQAVTENWHLLGYIRPEILPEIPEIFFRNLEILVQKNQEISKSVRHIFDPPVPVALKLPQEFQWRFLSHRKLLIMGHLQF